MEPQLGKIYICKWGDHQLIGIFTNVDNQNMYHFDLLIPSREGEGFIVRKSDDVRKPTLEELDNINSINSVYWA